MSMDKIANVNLETSANYQNLSKLNVQFWNQDKETAVLQFQITRNDFPLSLSKENVEVFIKLESGANYIVDSTEVTDGGFEIIDELNGIVSYTIPTEFMTVAQSVTGQVYVATKDREEVVVQRKISFEVTEDLLSTIPASEKLKEIKLFAQLRDEVSDTMAKLNEDFANMQDYVTMVNQAATDGVNQLNTLSENKLAEYNSNHNEKLNEITTTGDNYTRQFVDDKNYVDDKISEFEQKVMDSDVVTEGEASNWQKYKLTQDDGFTLFDENIKIDFNDSDQLSNLSIGTRYIVKSLNSPEKATSSHGWLTKCDRGDSKFIEYRPYDSPQVFVKRFYKKWYDWELITPDYDVIETLTGAQAKANTAESNAKVYTDEKVKNQHSVLFEGSVNGVGQTINMTESMFNYNLIIVSGSTPAGDFDRPVLVKQNSGDSIIISILNLIDSNGDLGAFYEIKLSKTNDTTLTIANDVFFDNPSNTGSGPNANRFTIKRIEGWK